MRDMYMNDQEMFGPASPYVTTMIITEGEPLNYSKPCISLTLRNSENKNISIYLNQEKIVNLIAYLSNVIEEMK